MKNGGLFTSCLDSAALSHVPPCLGRFSKEDRNLGLEFWDLPPYTYLSVLLDSRDAVQALGEGTATIVSLGGK